MGNNCCKNKQNEFLTINTSNSDNNKESNTALQNEVNSDKITNVNDSNIILSFKDREQNEIKKFIQDILNEFNMVRTDPLAYCKKIESHISYILLKQEGNHFSFYYDNIKYPKVFLKDGENAFKDCVDFLKTIEPLQPLELNEQIIIKVPNVTSEMTDKNIIFELIKMKKKELINQSKNSYFGFHYDNGFINAEISALLQIVDDNNSNAQRRNNILNPLFKYLGVSVGKIKPGRFISYFSFTN